MAEQPPSAIPSTQKQNESLAYGRGVWISYKVDFRSRVRSSLHSVARFLRIMSQSSSEPMEEFNGLKEDVGFDHVEGFCTSLSNLYKSAATHSIDQSRWKVTRISTFKSTGGVQHESLVVEVVCGRVIVYLRIERKLHKSGIGKLFSRRKSSKASPKTQTSDDSDPSPDSTTYPRDATRPTPTRPTSKIASDEITYSGVFTNVVSFNGEEWVDAVEFPEGKQLSLPQIAVLARCVNSLGRTYNLVSENCYWFAHVMVETAKLIQPDFKPSTDSRISKKKRGTWSGFLTTEKPTPELIEQAKFTYDRKWEAFNKDIYDTINNENSEIYQKERQKRQEAERLIAEKEKQEKEERRKREEAERLGAEKDEEIKRLRAELAASQAANGANTVTSSSS
ncbi:hypothetical protein M378DRAFT_14346 [Amanita muscaria Koide BX008]|uniref:Uncharacterized protein n=1 Tax=Amanita muscaria (strain Koide BX008) TaxID=946122 RepID=A0A0C2WV19_AMAMK|nr:hypothetical protein M378DRAFT_14346 [Amanita muscaria Koide BX008]